MKYQYLTLNTGHLSRHDTDVNLDPRIVDQVAALLARGCGSIPAVRMPLMYMFTDSGSTAAGLSVTAGVGVCVWTAGFYLHADKAFADGMTELARRAQILPDAIPRKLGPPGLALVIQEGAVVVPGDDIKILADFAKTLFSVWALQRVEELHQRAGGTRLPTGS